jgi:hypothetical protein
MKAIFREDLVTKKDIYDEIGWGDVDWINLA